MRKNVQRLAVTCLRKVRQTSSSVSKRTSDFIKLQLLPWLEEEVFPFLSDKAFPAIIVALKYIAAIFVCYVVLSVVLGIYLGIYLSARAMGFKINYKPPTPDIAKLFNQLKPKKERYTSHTNSTESTDLDEVITKTGETFSQDNPEFKPETKEEQQLYDEISNDSERLILEIVEGLPEEKLEILRRMLAKHFGITIVD